MVCEPLFPGGMIAIILNNKKLEAEGMEKKVLRASEAISNYVKSFDSMLKAWLSGRLDASGLAESYNQAFPQGPGV